MSYSDSPRLVWRKSSFSASGNCVEVAIQGGNVFIRDSKKPNGEVLSISYLAWQRFIQAVR